MKQTRISTEQTLHYLGVPLSLQYYIKKSNTWKAYISGGAEIDWNISAKSVTEGVNTSARKDRAQWSLGAGVGIEYDILPQLGIYAEPGFRYYLNNGSTVQNFFKDQPASWSLEFGVRLNLNTP
jgi:outer membrane autotransporter protein